MKHLPGVAPVVQSADSLCHNSDGSSVKDVHGDPPAVKLGEPSQSLQSQSCRGTSVSSSQENPSQHSVDSHDPCLGVSTGCPECVPSGGTADATADRQGYLAELLYRAVFSQVGQGDGNQESESSADCFHRISRLIETSANTALTAETAGRPQAPSKQRDHRDEGSSAAAAAAEGATKDGSAIGESDSKRPSVAQLSPVPSFCHTPSHPRGSAGTSSFIYRPKKSSFQSSDIPPSIPTISASTDPFIIDQLTAATINFLNRDDLLSEETSSSSTTSPNTSAQLEVSNEAEPQYGSIEEDRAASMTSLFEPSDLKGQSNDRRPTIEAPSKEQSMDQSHSQEFIWEPSVPFELEASLEKHYPPPSSPPVSPASYAPIPKGLLRVASGQPTSGLPRPAVSVPRSRTMETPEEAWRKLSEKLRRLGVSLPSARSVSYHPSRYLGVNPPSWRGRLIEMLVQQAKKRGKYVKWAPSMELALSSCLEEDVMDAVETIAKSLLLRERFIVQWPQLDSPCVLPAPEVHPGTGSTEPLFDPTVVPCLEECPVEYQMEHGVYMVYWTTDGADMSGPAYNGQQILRDAQSVPSVVDFLSALRVLMAAVQHPACKSFAYRRLEYLRNKFAMHLMFNSVAELHETKQNSHRDFYNVRKVDTHVHHSACMHQKRLLRFIRKKFRTEPDAIVARTAAGDPVTLREIFEREVGVSAWEASVDHLNVHALGSCFHRFDVFNSKYNPFGQAILRDVFLKIDNTLKGRYLAEITADVIRDLEEAKYQFVEWRLSIYGKSKDEWKRLAVWVKENRLWSKQVRWMVQIPRLYHVYRKLNLIKSFAELLENVFEPLFAAVKDPSSHPEIHFLLLQMDGWDSVDDESIVSKYTSEGGGLPLPADWTDQTNPPYSYWAYYMYANIRNLNVLLRQRGMKTLPFRPHCGEAGSISHLASMYLLADGINHGIMLRKTPVLQYLYYLRQIGLAVSPLSNNALFHDLAKNPFYEFFSVGMNVSLSTDDPLMFHFTDEPLLEEYSCCAHFWKLSPVDLCELARNSVLQSAFEPQLKRHWLGANYALGGLAGNSSAHSNLSNIRARYREDTLLAELRYVSDVLHLRNILDCFVDVPNTF